MDADLAESDERRGRRPRRPETLLHAPGYSGCHCLLVRGNVYDHGPDHSCRWRSLALKLCTVRPARERTVIFAREAAEEIYGEYRRQKPSGSVGRESRL